MPYSAAVVAELNRDLLALTRERAEIDERIAALRKVLRRSDEAQTQTAPKPVLPRAPKGAPKRVNKAVVFNALKENPGVKAADITKLLRQRGFTTPPRAKPLSHRVYNELWRMVKDERATKTPDGRFWPKEGAA